MGIELSKKHTTENKNNPQHWSHQTQVLTKGKQFLFLIRHTSYYSHSHVRKKEERKNLHKRENVHFYLRNGYLKTVSQVMLKFHTIFKQLGSVPSITVLGANPRITDEWNINSILWFCCYKHIALLKLVIKPEAFIFCFSLMLQRNLKIKPSIREYFSFGKRSIKTFLNGIKWIFNICWNFRLNNFILRESCFTMIGLVWELLLLCSFSDKKNVYFDSAVRWCLEIEVILWYKCRCQI